MAKLRLWSFTVQKPKIKYGWEFKLFKMLK